MTQTTHHRAPGRWVPAQAAGEVDLAEGWEAGGSSRPCIQVEGSSAWIRDGGGWTRTMREVWGHDAA